MACLGTGVGTNSLGGLSLPVEVLTAANNEPNETKKIFHFNSRIKLIWQV